MTQKEKAKAYDGLIERLKDLKFAYRFSPLSDTMEEKFPELKESENEKIRKDILAFIRREGQHIDKYKWHKWIAWLEKQGEQEPVNEHKFNKGITVNNAAFSHLSYGK